MCGIIALTGKNAVRHAKTSAMLEALALRGPDDAGTMPFANCVLGQTRLSIIDLSGGRQPMRDNARAQAITFNGEIYNYPQLKRELEGKGHVFSTDSDTEVILKAYQEYGEACVEHFDGMFAFAIWDEDAGTLFLARDRFGKKPLYYAYTEVGDLLVASEIKALTASGLITPVIDPEAIDLYLALMYLPPWRTVYKNVHVIPPASRAWFKDGKLDIEQYWRLEKRSFEIGYDEAKQETKRLLRAAVKKRLVADVEIGSFLSGGVDSTIVTEIAQSFLAKPIKTFAVGYQDYINELPFASQAAAKIGTDHYTLQANDDMVAELHKVMAYYDEPHADSSDFPQHLLSRFAGSKVKVALAGDGADEFFLGYGWHTRHLNLSYRKHFIEKVFMDPFAGFLKNIQIFSPTERKKLWKDPSCVSDDILSAQLRASSLAPVEKINLFDVTTYLPGQLLTKADRMGMMHSIEVRSPFLDHHLAEFVYNLPTEYKANKDASKIILKDILTETMPKEFVYRRKQGFGAPVKNWLRKEAFKADVSRVLGDANAKVFGFLKPAGVRSLIDRFYTRGEDGPFYQIWVLYCLELWLREHRNEARL